MKRLSFAHTSVESGESIASLTEGEQLSLARFRAPDRRDSFIAGRRAAKMALRALIGEGPELEILAGEAGEPRVNMAGWGVSIAHSDGLAAAIAYRLVDDGAVGLDLERIRPLGWETAELFCSPEELADFRDEAGRDLQLMKRWTAKEAVFKAGFPQGSFDLREIGLREFEAGREAGADRAAGAGDFTTGDYLVRSTIFGEYLVALALPRSLASEMDGILPAQGVGTQNKTTQTAPFAAV